MNSRVHLNVYLALCFLLSWGVQQNGKAQAPPEGGKEEHKTGIAILVIDFRAPGTRHTDTLGNLVRDAVATEFQRRAPGHRLLDRKDMVPAAKDLGLRLPVGPQTPTEFTNVEWRRLARELKADATLSGDVRSQPGKNGKRVVVSFVIRDIKDEEPLNGGVAQVNIVPSRGETDDAALRRTATVAAQEAVEDFLQRPSITTTIFSIRGENIIIGGGRRDGLKPGDEMNVYRYTDRGYVKSGRIRITNTNETQSDAKVIANLGIAPEDTARRAYRPEAPRQ